MSFAPAANSASSGMMAPTSFLGAPLPVSGTGSSQHINQQPSGNPNTNTNNANNTNNSRLGHFSSSYSIRGGAGGPQSAAAPTAKRERVQNPGVSVAGDGNGIGVQVLPLGGDVEGGTRQLHPSPAPAARRRVSTTNSLDHVGGGGGGGGADHHHNQHGAMTEEDEDRFMAELDALERLRDGGTGGGGGGGGAGGGESQLSPRGPPVVELVENHHHHHHDSGDGGGDQTMLQPFAFGSSGGGGVGATANDVQYLQTTVEVVLTSIRISLDCFISHDWDASVGMMVVNTPAIVGGSPASPHNNTNNNPQQQQQQQLEGSSKPTTTGGTTTTSTTIPSPFAGMSGVMHGGGAGGSGRRSPATMGNSGNPGINPMLSQQQGNALGVNMANANASSSSPANNNSGGGGLFPTASGGFSPPALLGSQQQQQQQQLTHTHIMPPFVATLSHRSLAAMHALYRTVPRQGCKLISIDGEKVSTSADVRQILMRHDDEQDTIVIGFVQLYSHQQQLMMQQHARAMSIAGGGGGGAPLSFASAAAPPLMNNNSNAVMLSMQQQQQNNNSTSNGTTSNSGGGGGGGGAEGGANTSSPLNGANASPDNPMMIGIGTALAKKYTSSSSGGGFGGTSSNVNPLGPLGPALPVLVPHNGQQSSSSPTGGGGHNASVNNTNNANNANNSSYQQQQPHASSLGLGDMSPTDRGGGGPLQHQQHQHLQQAHQSQPSGGSFRPNGGPSTAPGSTTYGGGGGGYAGGNSMMMRSSMAEGEASQQFDRSPMEVFSNAVDRVKPGKCIILLHHQLPPPVRLVEEVARQRGAHITLMDMGVTIHRRPRHEQAKDAMRSALALGDWLVISNATKSMATMGCLEEVIAEIQSAQEEGGGGGAGGGGGFGIYTSPSSSAAAAAAAAFFGGASGGGGGDSSMAAANWAQRSARIIIIAEPHPHFPKSLLGAGNIVFRHCDVRGDDASQSRETLRESMARLKLLKASQAMLSTSQAANDLPGIRKVRISSSVDVVSYEQSADYSMLIEEGGFGGGGGSHSGGAGGGGIVAPEVRPECVSLQGEQFTCLEDAGDGRIAAGSSGGNVYVYSVKGQSLLTFHAHQCTVWGMDFRGHHEFVLGSEDACLSHWSHDLHSNVPGYKGQVITRFSSDVLAVRYVDPLRSDVAVAGGLNGSLCFVNVSTGKRLVVPTVSTILCLSRVPYTTHQMLMGGGTGLVTVWDCDRGVPTGSFLHHRQKVSCVAAHEGMLISSSFDGSVVLSDMRVKTISCRLSPGGQQGGPVTCFAQKGTTLAVAAEDSLCVYDLRKPPQLLHHRQNAWHSGHFARGLQLDDSEGYPIAIAASSDGILRFFGCV